MPLYEITRTEEVTRVWRVDADSEDDALEHYMDEDPIDALTHHFGHPFVQIELILRQRGL